MHLAEGLAEDIHGRRGRLRQMAAGVLGAALMSSALAAAAPRAGVGLNLASWEYFSPDFPLIDQFKRSSGWLTQCEPSRDARCRDFAGQASAWDTLEEARLDLDPQGWPRRLPAADDPATRYRAVAVLLFNGNGHAHPAGKYVVTYDGKGVLAHDLIGRKIDRESRPGRDVVEVSNQIDGGWRITIRATDPKDHLRNIRVYPPGGGCQRNLDRYAASTADCDPKADGAFVPFEKYPADRYWHPRFLQDLRGFRVLRFMDWGKTNSSPLAQWRDRPQLDAASWSGDGGVPLEAMLALSRAAGADPWLNLPMRASDDYVKGFARLLKEQLAPGQVAIVEYANEPWNEAFPVARWMQQQAAAQWPGAAAKAGGPAALAASWYARRSAQICQAVKAEWGGPGAPVRCVLNGQAANPDLLRQLLACPQAAAELGAPCAKRVDALAIAPYFGAYLAEPRLRAALADWPRDPDGGLGRLFQELLGEDARGAPVRPPLQGRPEAADGGALAQARGWMRAAKAQADAFGLPLWAYEGGQHLTLPPDLDDPAWLALIVAANRDPRMGRAYERHLADWRAAGGQLFVWFNHMAVPSKWGAWGLKETQFSDAGVKWQTVRTQRDSLTCWWSGCER
ncbi:hypothetical protein [Ideonella sp.]|uniref:hypothetical protein n=1 Tax=Ideonella sp. TaxID=1929293 RepID=UPI002B48F5CB|nr:hypothetical protein [Ideonella sp.]HJV70887.1 hypothetical protein [Ideonella sp.]